MHMGQRVISADNHIVDPKDLYAERMPEEFRDRAPRVLRGPDGGDGWSFAGEAPVAHVRARGRGRPGVSAASSARAGSRGTRSCRATTTARPTSPTWTVTASMAWSCTRASRCRRTASRTASFALAIIRTYNDWVLDDFEAADRDRLVGLCCVPVDDGMDAAVAEVERCAAKGARGFFLPGMPERGYWEPLYDPLWAAATDADITLSFHRNHGGRPRGDEVPMLDVPGLNVGGIAARFFSAVTPFTYMIFTGLFERFPDAQASSPVR